MAGLVVAADVRPPDEDAVGEVQEATDRHEVAHDEGNSEERDFGSAVAGGRGAVAWAVDAAAVEQDEAAEARRSGTATVAGGLEGTKLEASAVGRAEKDARGVAIGREREPEGDASEAAGVFCGPPNGRRSRGRSGRRVLLVARKAPGGRLRR